MFASLLRNPSRGRSTQSLSRSTRLGVEVLEGRSVPSASRIAVVEAPTLATSDWPPPPGRPAQVSRMSVNAGQIEVMLSRGSLEEIPLPVHAFHIGEEIPQLSRRDAGHIGEEIPQ